GTIALRTPKLRTLKGQLLSVALLDPGIALTDGLIDFQLEPGGVLAIQKTTWKFAGGELRAENATIDLAAERTPVKLEAHGLDLAALLPLAAVKGLAGTGRIDGEIPLESVGSELRVANGILRARPEGGAIRYTPTDAMRAYAESRPNDLGIALTAFEDFRYDVLEARIDGDVRGELRIALHVRGANPAFQSGQPIELNLNLDARLLDLVRAGVSAYRVPDAVEERLRKFSEEEKKK
ncbi:MAG: intermembrane phospholipid transport protein YdbH family protein, partial [Myxococcota bacterium]